MGRDEGERREGKGREGKGGEGREGRGREGRVRKKYLEGLPLEVNRFSETAELTLGFDATAASEYVKN